MKTYDLQQQPVQFLVNCDTTGTGTWTANGTYLNDDGEVLNTTKKQNIYKIDFDWDQTKATFSFSRTANATDANVNATICAECVNMNDVMDQFTIYNADALGMNRDFSNLVLNLVNGTQVSLTGTAKYD